MSKVYLIWAQTLQEGGVEDKLVKVGVARVTSNLEDAQKFVNLPAEEQLTLMSNDGIELANYLQSDLDYYGFLEPFIIEEVVLH